MWNSPKPCTGVLLLLSLFPALSPDKGGFGPRSHTFIETPLIAVSRHLVVLVVSRPRETTALLPPPSLSRTPLLLVQHRNMFESDEGLDAEKLLAAVEYVRGTLQVLDWQGADEVLSGALYFGPFLPPTSLGTPPSSLTHSTTLNSLSCSLSRFPCSSCPPSPALCPTPLPHLRHTQATRGANTNAESSTAPAK